jgi:beta-lactam-binding protein with PASTA domain
VTAQKPLPNKKVARGSKVRINVSTGSASSPGTTNGTTSATTTQVPDMVGQDQQTATSTLKDAGFKVNVIMMQASDPSQNGIVADEQPTGGTRAPDGSTVTIYVGSSG